MRPVLIPGAAFVAALLAAAPADASGWSDTLSDNPQARNAFDTAEKAYEGWRTSGSASRGASGPLADLLYNSDTLICGIWIIQFRSWYFGFVVENVSNPTAETAEMERAAHDLLNAVIAACGPVLDPETARLVNQAGFTDPAPPAPVTAAPPFPVRELDGAWIVVADDELCARECEPRRRAFVSARDEVLRIERAIAAAEQTASVMETSELPSLEREVARARAEVDVIRQTLSQVSPHSQAYAEATRRLRQAEPEVGNRQRELEQGRAELDRIRREIADLNARLPAALNAMEAALEAYRACLRACVRQAEGRVDDRGRFARDTLVILDQWEQTIRNIREVRGIASDTRQASSVPPVLTLPTDEAIAFAPAGVGAFSGGGFLQLMIAGDSQAFCTYGPSVPEPAAPGTTARGDPAEAPPSRPEVPSIARTPGEQAAYDAWTEGFGTYWARATEGLTAEQFLNGDFNDVDEPGPSGIPVGVPVGDAADDDPRDAPPEEPDDPADETAQTVTLVVKATATAQLGAGQSAVGRTQARLFPQSVMNVALPSEGGPRPQTDAGEDPVTCVTGDDGTCTVEIDPCDFGNCAYAGDPQAPVEVEFFTTPVTSYVLRMASGATVPAALEHFVVSDTTIGGQAFVTVMAEASDDGELLGHIQSAGPGVLDFEENICRDKQPGPPADEPLMRGAGSWGQQHDDQWAIKRVGLTLTPDSAWNSLGPNPQPVTVAVIDTGLDWNHLDFSFDNIWKNPGETPDNGVDDDRNGYVDDVIGWDFMEGTNRPWDHDGHGTLVAGIIAADGSNGEGIAGINPHARIMVLRALNAFGHTRASYIAEAIVYAADNGARVINLSVGGPQLTRVEAAAIAHARGRGAVVVVAAGNEGVNVADFGMAGADGVIAVGAANLDDSHPAFSNWGAGVDIAAPGVDVLSLRARRTDTMLGIKDVPYEAGSAYAGADRRYYRISGTSFSAPIVAGVASLILSARPALTGEQVESILIQSAEDIQTPGVDQFSGAGMVDARAALAMDPAFRIEAVITGLEVVQGDAGPVVRVMGAVGADRLASARLDVGRGETPTAFTPVAEVAAGSGVLGDIPADAFRDAPVWTVRLTVTHAGGQTREARYVLDVGG